MSEELHTYIEPELEARITALVLGEASEFEVDELERLIEGQPELAIFRRRVELMHGLLGEAVRPQVDEAWQLSDDRRAMLRRAFARKAEPEAKRRRGGSVGYFQWRAAINIAACLVVCLVVFSMMTPVVMKQSKKALSDRSEIATYYEDGGGLANQPMVGADKEVARKSVIGGVESKPPAPSSSMAKVTAANSGVATAVPDPEVGEPDMSVDFGNGDDFGDGWENTSGLVVGSGGKFPGDVDMDGVDPFLNEGLDTSIAEKPSPKVKRKPIPLDKASAMAKNEVARRGLPQEPGSYFRSKGKEVSQYDSGEARQAVKSGEVGFGYEKGGEGNFNENGDAVVLRIGGSVKSGLRSGDFAVTRNSIDAILNNPNHKNKDQNQVSDPYAGRAPVLGGLKKDLTSSLGGRRYGWTVEGKTRKANAFHNDDDGFLRGRDATEVIPPVIATEEVRHAIDAGDSPASSSGVSSIAKKEKAIRGIRAGVVVPGRKVDQVRKRLYMGEGYYNLGKYDEAEAEMKKVLQTDPHNKAARSWLEKVAATKSDYHRAACDHTRAELLKEVDRAWEMSVPPELEGLPAIKPAPSSRPAVLTVGGKGRLAIMKQDLQVKSDRVSELRKRVMDIAEKVNIIYLEGDRGGEVLGDEKGIITMAEKELYNIQREKEQVTSHTRKLLSVGDEDLISVTAELPDVGFKEAYAKYEEAQTELATKRASGLGENHPDVKMRETRIAELRKNLQKRAIGVRKSLKHRLALIEGREAEMRKVVNREKDEGSTRAREFKEFDAARKAYQEAREVRDRVQIQYDREKVEALRRGDALPKEPSQRKKKTIPSPTKPKALPEETYTSAQPFSTFSLNVSDVSFKLAKSALLENGKWPDAAKVRAEEFVNAFDYGDPSPRRGEPVACAIEQAAHPFLLQRNLLRIGMKTAAMGRSQPLRLTVLLDNSGSMEREDREASVLAAMQVLAAQLGPQDVITVVGFARTPRLLADRISGEKADKLVEIVANTPSEGGTNLEEALRLARGLAKRQHVEGAQSRVVLITDGVANLGNTVPDELASEVEAMRQQGIAFDACGVGAEGLNDDILEALTRKGDGRYYFLNRPEDADSGFARQLAGALTPAAKNVKVQVVFNPRRVSRYRLLGFEKHRLKKEDFRNDKVDAAEMAAEEAGNAVYQVQVNPQGEGELGEVFVRFYDVSSGRMVERSWPLPYEPQAKPFDMAEPSMQLAGAAVMLGEKLHGTDAGSVRFPMISNTLHKLRAHYSHDSRVQDLIRMCEKVK